MSDRILVLCASRGRPEAVRQMIASVRATSTLADVAVYLDHDDTTRYGALDAKLVLGERVGQCRSLNKLVAHNPGYLAYGAATDDCTFQTPGWDEWVIATSRGFKGGIGALSPLCEAPRRMDFPWLTASWIEVAGAFVPLGTLHFYWDVALQLVGEATQIAFAGKDDFHITHQSLVPEDDGSVRGAYAIRALTTAMDAKETCGWLALRRSPLIEKLRTAIGGTHE